MRAKFALDITFQRQTWGDSPGAADRRSRAVEHEASGQRRTTCPHAGVLIKHPVAPVRCAGVGRNGGRLDTARAGEVRFLTAAASGKREYQLTAKARFALDRYN